MRPRPVVTCAQFAAALFVLLVASVVWPARADAALAAARLAWVAAVAAAGFRIVSTGRVSRYRRWLFVATAIGFIVLFRTPVAPRPAEVGAVPASCDASPRTAPSCHVALASSVLTFLHAQVLAVGSGQWATWGPLTLGTLWLLLVLVVGPAWCSWVCFHGGIDDGFAAARRRPRLSLERLAALRDLPAAVLVVSSLLAVASLTPVFCIWVCPLKLSGEFLDTAPAARAIQLALLVVAALALLIVLPVLSGKRTFCTYVCPVAAIGAAAGRVHPFHVAIAADRCVTCNRCVTACPVQAIDAEDLAAGRVGPWCNLCGACLDACPKDAMTYSVRGEPGDASLLVLFPALVVGGTVSGLIVPEAALLLLRWLAGG